VLAVFGKYFVDFAFLEQMRERYSDASNLAGFFGVFSGLTQGLALVIRLLLSGPLLQRYGIRLGLLVLPLCQLACTALIVLEGARGAAAASPLVFWLVIANQGIYKTLKHPIDNPSFKVLYQPLRAEERLAAQISVETIFTPITIGLAGAIMLVSTLLGYDPVRFSYVLLVTFAGWVAVARLGAGAYQGALVEVLRRRVMDDATLALDDADSVSILRNRLASADALEVIFALHLLEKADDPDASQTLLERLDHQSPEVRRYAVERLAALGATGAIAAVQRRVEIEPDPSALAAGVRALGVLGPAACATTLASFLNHPQLQVRRAALAALLGAPDSAARNQAIVQLFALTSSPRAADRIAAAQVLGERPAPDAEPVLVALLHDRDAAVRRAALQAASPASATVVGLMIEHLAQPAFAGAATAALARGGPRVVGVLRDRFIAGGSRALLTALARVLGQIGDAGALAFLRAQIAYPNTAVRGAVLESLLRNAVQVEGAERAAVERVLRHEAELATSLLGTRRDLPDQPAFFGLRQAIETDVARARARVFALLTLLYEREAILRARDNIESPARDKRAYALEVLDVTLGAGLKGYLLPLLDASSVEASLGGLERHFPEPRRSPADRIAQLIARDDGSFRAWTRASAAHAAAGAGLVDLARALAGLTTRDALLRETAQAAASRLEGRGGPDTKRSVPMLLIEKVMILKRVHMFQHSSEEILAQIAAALEELHAKAGEAVFRKGDAGDSMYVVVDGEVRVHDGDRTINLLGEREIFGELALLDPEPRSLSCSATRDTLLFRLDAETFSELMAGNIDIVRGVLHVLCERLRRVTAS
jgi:hypothetical protein